MSNLPNCPECNSEYTYEDRSLFICPECAHEWSTESEASSEDVKVVKDANGNILQDGDSVTVIKDLKVKGSSSVLKIGTKVKTSVWWMAITILTAKLMVWSNEAKIRFVKRIKMQERRSRGLLLSYVYNGANHTVPVPLYTFTSPSPEAAEPILVFPDFSTVNCKVLDHMRAKLPSTFSTSFCNSITTASSEGIGA